MRHVFLKEEQRVLSFDRASRFRTVATPSATTNRDEALGADDASEEPNNGIPMNTGDESTSEEQDTDEQRFVALDNIWRGSCSFSTERLYQKQISKCSDIVLYPKQHISYKQSTLGQILYVTVPVCWILSSGGA
jgi:hypothetical protein